MSTSQTNRVEPRIRMADVSGKQPVWRTAAASARVEVPAFVFDALVRAKAGELCAMPKGDPFATATLAGIAGAKQCAMLLPLCHPAVPLTCVRVDFELHERASQIAKEDGEKENTASNEKANSASVAVYCECKAFHFTGVEMEALCGAAAAALCLYDVCKPLLKSRLHECIRITDLNLVFKTKHVTHL